MWATDCWQRHKGNSWEEEKTFPQMVLKQIVDLGKKKKIQKTTQNGSWT